MTFVRAERKQSKARIALCGPSGSGKSYSALLLAKGIANGGKIAGIDTEHGSLSLYAELCEFDVCELRPPFHPDRYIEALHEAERAGYAVVVIDSITHEWSGQGGILDIKDKLPDRNEFSKWQKLTPMHQAFIDAMLASPCHIIVTMRSKTEYVQAEKNGKTVYEKTGTGPQQRDGMEYEFTLMFDVAQNHVCTSSKDRLMLPPGSLRASLWDQRYEKITEEHGREILDWLTSGKAMAPVTAPTPPAPLQRAEPRPAPPTTTSNGNGVPAVTLRWQDWKEIVEQVDGLNEPDPEKPGKKRLTQAWWDLSHENHLPNAMSKWTQEEIARAIQITKLFDQQQKRNALPVTVGEDPDTLNIDVPDIPEENAFDAAYAEEAAKNGTLNV
jgi:hypothetical protein